MIINIFILLYGQQIEFYNRLNDKNYGEYMSSKFKKCSNARITKFYGPFGTGKSTLVYLFFKVFLMFQV